MSSSWPLAALALLNFLSCAALHAAEPATAPATEPAVESAVESAGAAPQEDATTELPGIEQPVAPLFTRPDAKPESWHDRVFQSVQKFIEHADWRFARDTQNRLPVPITPFSLGLQSDVIREPGRTAIDPRLDVDLQLQMPNMQRRIGFFVTTDSVEEAPQKLGREASGIKAGVRLNPRPLLDFDIGVRIDVPPNLFTSLRWARNYELLGWQVQPFAKLYYETKSHLGFATSLTLDRWMDDYLFRSSTYANWRKDHADTEWTQTLILAHAQEILRVGRYSDVLGGRDLARGQGLQLLAGGTYETGTQSYEASVFYKAPTPKRWLYWHIQPLVRWERRLNWHPDPGFNIGLDAKFWALSDQ